MSYTLPTAFVAYPSQPPMLPETMRAAIDNINKRKQVHVCSWEELKVGGKAIAREVCESIAKVDLLIADVTGLNPNVLFEIGFAIARRKRLWLLLDNSLSKNDFSELHTLSTVGYSAYTASADITSGFFRDAPHTDLGADLLTNVIQPSLIPGQSSTLLYLKSQHETEASVQITKRLDLAPIKRIADDPREAPSQTLLWYGQQVYAADAVVCHLTNPARQGARIRNARYALVAGMAYGLGKHLLMLSEADQLAPLDYRDILRSYQTATAAHRHLDSWLLPLEEAWRESAQSVLNHRAHLRLATELKGLDLGEYIAEHEEERLVDGYFVETVAYREALSGTHTIFVGRKGTGKSANFLQLHAHLASDVRNILSVIKPVAYELESVIRVLSELADRDRKVYALEGLWKFLLYSDIANALAAKFSSKPLAAQTSGELSYLDFWESHKTILVGDFSARLERCLLQLEGACGLNAQDRTTETYRQQVSQALHSSLLSEVRKKFLEAIPRGTRVAIIVDNLDKAWDRQNDLASLAEFLLGLLGAANKVRSELKNAMPGLELSLAVFLRADIFEKVQQVAREPDKIKHTRLVWTDRELLYKLVAERFAAANSDDVPPDALWKTFFCPVVQQVGIREFLTSVIQPRPRDFLYLIKTAISTAINRGHARVEEDDVLEAYRAYSEFAAGILLIEDNSEDGVLEKVLYEFAGAPAHLSHDEVVSRIVAGGIEHASADAMVSQLCTLSFLGTEVSDNDFRFPDSASELKKVQVLARRLCETRSAKPRYLVHPAFHPFLELTV